MWLLKLKLGTGGTMQPEELREMRKLKMCGKNVVSNFYR